LEVPEVVINAVTFAMVQQTSLASTEYPKGENEFLKAGFTAIPSERIKPFRVKESPVQFECKVRQIIETGKLGGAGNLVICDVLLIHVDEDILDENGKIDTLKIELAGRLGGDYYVKTSGDAVFKVEKPLLKMGIGIDRLPEKIRHSKYLSGNDLGKLGNIESLPDEKDIENYKSLMMFDKTFDSFSNPLQKERTITNMAKNMLEEGNFDDALRVLIAYL
jgi:hypothetical protein